MEQRAANSQVNKMQRLILHVDGADTYRPFSDEHAQHEHQISIEQHLPNCQRAAPTLCPSPRYRARETSETRPSETSETGPSDTEAAPTKAVSSTKIGGGSPSRGGSGFPGRWDGEDFEREDERDGDGWSTDD